MLDANQIKIRLIDHFVGETDNELIASEVSFYHGYRRADLVRVDGEEIVAYEIKSDKDNLSKLIEQMKDYSNTFSYCYLVTTDRHLKTARSKLPKKVGIIVIREGEVVTLRKASENKRLSKHSLVLGLSQKSVGQLVSEKQKKLSLQKKRQYLEECMTVKTLKAGFLTSYLERYRVKYRNFMHDRGARTTLTDLHYLQSS